jgi:hypothetical protein
MSKERTADGGMWIDTTTYYGFCRRSAVDRFRFNERRREDTSTEPPSLPATLRKLRILSLSLEAPEARVGLLDRLNGAIDLAHAKNMNHCAAGLNDLAQIMMQAGADGARLGSEADRRLAAITASLANV